MMSINRYILSCALFLFGCIAQTNAQVKIITTIAGTGTAGAAGDGGAATAAQVSAPYGMAYYAPSNSLYIADQGNNKVRRINLTTGIISTIAGTGTSGYTGEGTATAVRLNQPSGVAVDAAGNVLIADAGNNRIRRVTPAGVISTIVGNGFGGFFGDVDGVVHVVDLEHVGRMRHPGEIVAAPARRLRLQAASSSSPLLLSSRLL